MSDSIDRVFVKAITIIKALSTRSGYGSLPRPPLESRVALYGLYKQATEGDVEGIIARPTGNSKEDIAAKNKWDAWKQQQGLSITAAKRKYISYLIDTMRIYATGTHEARELLAELEYLWDQIRDLESDSEGGLSESGAGAGAGNNNNNNSRDAVLSPYPYAQHRLSNSNSQNYITGLSDHNVDDITSANVNVSSAANNYNNLLYREISRQSSTSNANILPNAISNPNVGVNATANPNVTNGLLSDLYEKTGSNTEEIRSLKKEIKWAIESLNQEIKLLKHYNRGHNETHSHSRHASHGNYDEAGESVITAGNADTRNIRKNSQYQQHHQQDNDIQSIITSMYRYPVSRAGTTKVTQLPYTSKSYLFNNNNTKNNTANNANTANANSIINNDSFFDDRSSIIGGGDCRENKHWLLSRQPTLNQRNTLNNNNSNSSGSGNNRQSIIAKIAISVFSTLGTFFRRVGLLNTKYRILVHLKDLIKKIFINAVILFVVFKILNQRIRLVRGKDGSVVMKLDDRAWKGPAEKIKNVVIGGVVSANGGG